MKTSWWAIDVVSVVPIAGHGLVDGDGLILAGIRPREADGVKCRVEVPRRPVMIKWAPSFPGRSGTIVAGAEVGVWSNAVLCPLVLT